MADTAIDKMSWRATSDPMLMRQSSQATVVIRRMEYMGMRFDGSTCSKREDPERLSSECFDLL